MSAVLKPVAPRLIPMLAADLDGVMRIEDEIYDFPWTRGNFEDSLAAGYSAWLYADGVELVGYCVIMLAIDEAHLLNLSIARPWQGQGHGGALLEAALAAVREHGARSVLLEVRPTNTAGRRLYARSGFSQVGLRKNYYPSLRGREDAMVLKREL
jgi:ribosomal-protein-alanine N-acetyltransferase